MQTTHQALSLLSLFAWLLTKSRPCFPSGLLRSIVLSHQIASTYILLELRTSFSTFIGAFGNMCIKDIHLLYWGSHSGDLLHCYYAHTSSWLLLRAQPEIAHTLTIFHRDPNDHFPAPALHQPQPKLPTLCLLASTS